MSGAVEAGMAAVTAEEALRHSLETRELLQRHEDGCERRASATNGKIDRLDQKVDANAVVAREIQGMLEADKKAREARQKQVDRRQKIWAWIVTTAIAGAGLVLAVVQVFFMSRAG